MARKIESLVSNQNLVFVEPGTSIGETVEKMASAKVGTIFILKNGRLKGLFSERDLIQRVLTKGLDLKTTSIDVVMTKKLVTVGRGSSTASCFELMVEKNCRSLPVTAFWKKALGIITLIDVLMDLTTELAAKKKSFETSSTTFHFKPYPKKQLLKELSASQSLRTLTPQARVSDAVELMASANIGSVLVMDGSKLVGVFSERDVISKVFGSKLRPEEVKLEDVMTREVSTIDVNASTELCLATMKKLGCRSLPIEENGRVIGAVSIINCLRWMFEEFQHYAIQWDIWSATHAGVNSLPGTRT